MLRNSKRQMTFLDTLCLTFDQALRTLTGAIETTGAANPADQLDTHTLTPLDDKARKQVAALMRVNHAGEVCAQALYHGQGVVARTEALALHLKHAALEEGDHLSWCEGRLMELHSHTSYLNPMWYAGSFCIGMVAGMLGDQWSLGFVVETEQQVIKHLQKHLHLLPQYDQKSHVILQQMEQDEASHRDAALKAGARKLPAVIQQSMAFVSKMMVKTAYWI